MGKKVYAIKEGFDALNKKKIENVIVKTWAECLKYVKGVKGAKYKSFENIDEANTYLNDSQKLLKKGVDEYPEDCIHVYVDGSYNISTEKYSYALTVVKDNKIIYIENGSAEDNSQKQLRQIAGELKAAVRAAEYAVSNGEKKLVLFHDYEGIYHHAVGTWERKDTSSKEYYDLMNNFIKAHNLDIIFVKVDSHTGDIYNEITDNYAKLAAGITLTDAVDKWLNSGSIIVNNEEIKKSLFQIISSKNHDKITVYEEKNLEKLDDESDIEQILNHIKLLKGKNNNELLIYINNLDSKTKNKLILTLIEFWIV